MTAARPRFAWTPLTMTYAEAADVAFRKSENWLREHIKEYKGFPRPDKDTQLFLAEQVNNCVARGRMPRNAGSMPRHRRSHAAMRLNLEAARPARHARPVRIFTGSNMRRSI